MLPEGECRVLYIFMAWPAPDGCSIKAIFVIRGEIDEILN